MLQSSLLTLGLGPILAVAVEQFSVPNVEAIFETSPKPFEIHVDRQFIEETRLRVENTRSPVFLNAIGDGPSAENFTAIRDFWANEYSWNDTEAAINSK